MLKQRGFNATLNDRGDNGCPRGCCIARTPQMDVYLLKKGDFEVLSNILNHFMKVSANPNL